MSLVCPSIDTQFICQFWARSGLGNMSKTIEYPAKCGVHAVIRFLYFWTSDEECCPQVLSAFMTILGRIGYCSCNKEAPEAFSMANVWSPTINRSLWFSSLSSYETVVGGQQFGAMSCKPAQLTELAESTGGWLLWRGYWKVGTTLRKMSTLARRLWREVAGRCGSMLKINYFWFSLRF